MMNPRPLHALPSSRARAACAGWSAALALSACAFGPSGERPAAPSPPHYSAQPLPAETVSAQGVSQRFALGARPVPDWWKLYRSDVLDALVDEGLRNSPTLAATDKTLQAAREQLRAQIGENLLPTVDAGVNVANQRAMGFPSLGPATLQYKTFVGQVRANYTIDLFGAARLANRALAARVDLQSYQLDAARRALAANIVSAVITAAALGEQLDATQQLARLAAALAQDTARRETLGAASSNDTLNARQDAQTAAAAVPPLRAQWLGARHALAVLVGRTPDQAPPDIALTSLTPPDTVPVSVPSELLKDRPDVLAAEASVRAAAADIGVATAAMFPSLTLSASFGQGGFTWPLATSAAGGLWSIGAGLTQPLFHGGALRAQRRAAVDAYDAALAQYRQTVLGAFQNVADILTALEQDAHTLSAAQQAHDAATLAARNTHARYALGALPVDAVRASEQREQNARISALRATAARLADTASLFQAMGSGPSTHRDPHRPATTETAGAS